LAIKYRLLAIVALAILLACGPKPVPELMPPVSDPQEIWGLFASRYEGIHSLALSGSFSVINEKTYDSKLQVIFGAPDSFAFLAEGTLGVDIARGALVNGAGFWESPREDYYEDISRGDAIELGEAGISLDIDILLKSIFFFQNLDEFTFAQSDGIRYYYLAVDSLSRREFQVNRATATPMSQTIFYWADSDTQAVYIDYYGWQSLSEEMIIPGRITVKFDRGNAVADYRISRAKYNPDVPESFFKPRQ
jgi:hypothetical protein